MGLFKNLMNIQFSKTVSKNTLDELYDHSIGSIISGRYNMLGKHAELPENSVI